MIFTMPADQELTEDRLKKCIEKHTAESTKRYAVLKDAYMTKYEIDDMPAKDSWKPDNRLKFNFAKYIVDTMNGFFIGNPIKLSVDEGDEEVSQYLEFLDQYNDQDDNNAELSKICSIYGSGYEMYYVDELGNVGITYLNPMECFMIVDDSILQRERYFVRVFKDEEGDVCGSVADSQTIRWFKLKGKIEWGDEKVHGFDGVPATEFVENAERQGIFEPVMSLINAYNKGMSEKANDVDYFADAYLKILGPYLDENDTKNIRENRIINFDGDAKEIIVEFLQKPDGDVTQEHLLDRLERLIFQLSMVANISDENFGASSGIALKYKLQSMSNLEKTKERKFTSGMNRRYKIIFSNPVNQMHADDWVKIHMHFTPNIPANLLEETQIVQNLQGLVSQETYLKILSIVDDVKAEIDRMVEEDQKLKQDPVMDQMFQHTHTEEGEVNEQ